MGLTFLHYAGILPNFLMAHKQIVSLCALKLYLCTHTHVNGARTKDGVALGHAALTPEIVFHLVSLWLTKDTCTEAEDPETKHRPVYNLVWMSLMWMQSNSNQICCLN